MRYVFFIGVLLLAACVPAGDAAFLVKGSLLNQQNEPIDNCLMKVMFGDSEVTERKVSGLFDETVVFYPSGLEDIEIKLKCDGYSNEKIHTISSIPKSLDEHVDIGEVTFTTVAE